MKKNLTALLLTAMLSNQITHAEESCTNVCSDRNQGEFCKKTNIDCRSIIHLTTTTKTHSCSAIIQATIVNFLGTARRGFLTITAPNGFVQQIPFTVTAKNSLTLEHPVSKKGRYTLQSSTEIPASINGVFCTSTCTVDVNIGNCFLPLILSCCS